MKRFEEVFAESPQDIDVDVMDNHFVEYVLPKIAAIRRFRAALGGRGPGQ